MNDLLKIKDHIGWRSIAGEVVAFNCKTQQIVIWNEVASQLWLKIADKPCESVALISWLEQEYNLSFKTAYGDIYAFMWEAASLDLLEQNRFDLPISENTEENGENVLLAVEMKAIEKMIPFAVTFETTYTCNEHCIHCYMEKGGKSLSLKEIKIILDDLAKAECLFLSLTGGEFFLRPDALEIIEYASKLHFVIDILSNGTFIDRGIVEVLAQNPVRRVQISLYGATPEMHDSISNLPNSFNRTIDGIKLLKKAGIKVEIAFPLMQVNWHERHQVKNLSDSLDCLISPSHVITARNNGRQDTFPLRLTDKQLKEFWQDEELSGLYAGRKPFRDHQFYFKFDNLLDAAPCYSGFNSCAITPSGQVLACNQFVHSAGDLKQSNFLDIWRNSDFLKFLRTLKIKDLTTCPTCKLLPSCARCPGLAFLEGGSVYGKSPENCRIASINSAIAEERR